jgi:hypothetical protein
MRNLALAHPYRIWIYAGRENPLLYLLAEGGRASKQGVGRLFPGQIISIIII